MKLAITQNNIVTVTIKIDNENLLLLDFLNI